MKFENFIDKLYEFDKQLFQQWARTVPDKLTFSLKQCLIKQNAKSKELELNFNPEVFKSTAMSGLIF